MPGKGIALLDEAGKTVEKRRANELGGALFRDVKPGDGYRVRRLRRDDVRAADGAHQARRAPPSTDVYDQTIPSDGYGYLTTRDGTKLAYSVHPPQTSRTSLGVDLPKPPADAPIADADRVLRLRLRATRRARRAGSRRSPTSWASRSST